ncbi:TnsA endonuclease N-terminal domain-containing protein [Marinicella marina]|uniref:TnsA endonuclease N-terminal domain-containing protein n=1 Tax=Marinicella marina TaxID=2996016 RepID=UPI0024BBF5EB|nr:TnsA endonuclease N-terminal domain-containing protein [Marinicella marina]MDJ1138790.1 TnsA endonuclease N-terminal domain-containing protein [Marinicella marina]
MTQENASEVKQNSTPDMKIKNVILNQQDDNTLKAVRKIPRTYRSIRAKSINPQGNPIHFESKLEHDAYILICFDFEVANAIEQPVRFEYENDDGKKRSYTPDILIEIDHKLDKNQDQRPILVEVKYHEELLKDPKRIAEEKEIAEIYCEQEDWRFKLITDQDVSQIKLKNVKFLKRFDLIEDKLDFDHEISPKLLKELSKGESTPKTLISKITDSPQDFSNHLPYLWHLIRWKHILINVDKPLTMTSKIWLKKNKK